MLNRILGAGAYIAAALAVVTFSQFMVQLFGQTIPGVVGTFMRDVGEAFVLAAVVVFAFAWILKARPHGRPRSYIVIIFDIFGKETVLEGLRTRFRTHDVAWSYMKQYKGAYPLHNFALVSGAPKTAKRTIFRYI